MRSPALLAALLLLSACSIPPASEIPLPDLTGAEAEVVVAVERTRNALSRSPDSARAWADLGDRYRAGEWFPEAAECYREAERLEPEEFLWPYLLGHSLKQADPAQSAAALARALEIDADYAPAHLVYAERLAELGRNDEARRQFETTLRIDSANPHAHAGLGQLSLSEDDLSAAREHLERALAIDPRKGDARRWLAQVYLALGDEERARDQSDLAQQLPYRRVVQDPRAQIHAEPAGSIAHINAGKQLLTAGKPAEAAEEFREALQSDPDSSSAHYRLSMALTVLGQLDQAVHHLEEFRRIQPDSASYFRGMGEWFAKQEKWSEAETHWRQGLELSGDDPEIHFALGDLLARQEQPVEAEMRFRESLRLDPSNPDVHFALGALLDRQGRAEEAEKHLRESVRFEPYNARVQRYLGTFLSRSNRLEEGVVHLAQAVRLEPQNADGQVNLGLALKRLDRTREAIAAYREAVRLEPGWSLPAQRLAWIYATHPDGGIRDAATAVQLAEQAAKLSPTGPEEFDTLAAAYAEAGRHDEAVRTAQRSLDLCASNGRTALAEAVRKRMQLYAEGRPYREKAKVGVPNGI